MEAAVERVLVFRTARLAHLELAHRRPGAVVWDVFDDREARAAVGAVDEWIAEAAISRIEQLSKAIRAGGDVGRDRDELRLIVIALDDAKVRRVCEIAKGLATD